MEEYVHNYVKQIIDMTIDLKEKNLVDTTYLEFQRINYHPDGPFKTKTLPEMYQNIPLTKYNKTVDMFQILTSSVDELLDFIRKTFDLNGVEETFIDVDQNKTIVKGLYQKIETLKNNYDLLESKYYELRTQARTHDIKDLQKIQMELEETKMTLAKKERDFDEIKKNNQGTEKIITNLRDKLRENEEELKQMRENHERRLELLEGINFVLQEEFQKVKSNIDMYSHLFKTESQMRKKVLEEKKQLQEMVEKLAQNVGNEKNKIKTLKKEVIKQENLQQQILQDNLQLQDQIKELLDNKKFLEQQIAEKNIIIENKEENQELIDLRHKQLEIEDQLKANNRRINQLEDHKKKLLDILKKNKIPYDAIIFIVDDEDEKK